MLGARTCESSQVEVLEPQAFTATDLDAAVESIDVAQLTTTQDPGQQLGFRGSGCLLKLLAAKVHGLPGFIIVRKRAKFLAVQNNALMELRALHPPI